MQEPIVSDLRRFLQAKARRKRIALAPELKTRAMKQLELIWDTPIEDLLMPGVKLQVVADKLGLEQSTVSKWRKRLGVREVIICKCYDRHDEVNAWGCGCKCHNLGAQEFRERMKKGQRTY